MLKLTAASAPCLDAGRAPLPFWPGLVPHPRRPGAERVVASLRMIAKPSGVSLLTSQLSFGRSLRRAGVHRQDKPDASRRPSAPPDFGMLSPNTNVTGRMFLAKNETHFIDIPTGRIERQLESAASHERECAL